MSPESGRYTLSRIVFLVLAVATLGHRSSSHHSSCMDEIPDFANQENPMTGSYFPIENPQDDEVVSGIVAATETAYNLKSNDLQQFKASENEGIEAYSQVVYGFNYCVRFTLVSVDSNDEKKVTCVVSAYKAFSDKAATIDADTLECTAVA